MFKNKHVTLESEEGSVNLSVQYFWFGSNSNVLCGRLHIDQLLKFYFLALKGLQFDRKFRVFLGFCIRRQSTDQDISVTARRAQ